MEGVHIRLGAFEQAVKGAMPKLTKMREEGITKAWGLGVNTVEPMCNIDEFKYLKLKIRWNTDF